MSTEHDCNIVRLGPILKHENADTLGITNVDGRPCIVRLSDWAEGDLALYIPIDAMCPVADPRFAFLATNHKTDSEGRARVKASRLRGVFSMGLLVKPDADMQEGDEVREKLGIGIYEPGIAFGLSPDTERDPGFLPTYDIESARKWSKSVFTVGEEIVLTEKLHGSNARFAWYQDRLWCASRNRFAKPPTQGSLFSGVDVWWMLAQELDLATKLQAVPGYAIYGEAYGQVQDLKYGLKNVQLAVFDVLHIESRRWLDYDEALDFTKKLGLPSVPELYRGPWTEDLFKLAEGNSVQAVLNSGADHVREGWVAKPVKERFHQGLGRVIVKLHGEGYLTRKSG